MSFKSLVRKICITITALIVLFFAIEILYRLNIGAFPFYPNYDNDFGFVYDSRLGYRIKGVKGYNSLGLKNPEISPKQGQFRVLLLGDSVIWGFNPDLLRQALEVNDPARNIEIINAGIPGYTTKQEFDFLKLYGLSAEPDLVIFNFLFNDLLPYLHRPAPDGRSIEWYPSARRNSFGKENIIGRFFWRSYLAHFTVGSLSRIYKKYIIRQSYEFEKMIDFNLAWKDFVWDDYKLLLEEIGGFLQSRKIPFVIVCFPLREQLADYFTDEERYYALKPQRKLAGICRKLNIPFLNLWDLFYENRDKTLFIDQLHPGYQGNVLFALKLSDFLVEQDLIPLAAE
ncbi:MAG: SGNH/GDSL hydrolase family protein [Candidatus Omnitrophica bacterium]|nr:SGNH/GDSL hydrolase family protein [Candidatus Omnitrophota bacterium]